ncbi:MAG: terminase small subunit [Oscillospiraceae bacterium]|nr:terminase small subunit [Oscillospiraceae bacterium]
MKKATTGNNLNLPKEKLEEFCIYYHTLCDPKEAARKIGITDNPELAGLKLLYSKRVQKMLARLTRPAAYESVRSGLERLAFGNILDAVKLIRDEGELDISSLDLFNVSEVKKVKGGGVEIKFFNRLEALEKLLQIEESFGRSATAESFFNALGASAKAETSFKEAGDEP